MPDLAGHGQDALTDREYVAFFHDYHQFISSLDPTAQFANAGLAMTTTPTWRADLTVESVAGIWDNVLALYYATHGVEMPIDVWNMHLYAGDPCQQGDLHRQVSRHRHHGLSPVCRYHSQWPVSELSTDHDRVPNGACGSATDPQENFSAFLQDFVPYLESLGGCGVLDKWFWFVSNGVGGMARRRDPAQRAVDAGGRVLADCRLALGDRAAHCLCAHSHANTDCYAHSNRHTDSHLVSNDYRHTTPLRPDRVLRSDARLGVGCRGLGGMVDRARRPGNQLPAHSFTGNRSAVQGIIVPVTPGQHYDISIAMRTGADYCTCYWMQTLWCDGSQPVQDYPLGSPPGWNNIQKFDGYCGPHANLDTTWKLYTVQHRAGVRHDHDCAGGRRDEQLRPLDLFWDNLNVIPSGSTPSPTPTVTPRYPDINGDGMVNESGLFGFYKAGRRPRKPTLGSKNLMNDSISRAHSCCGWNIAPDQTAVYDRIT